MRKPGLGTGRQDRCWQLRYSEPSPAEVVHEGHFEGLGRQLQAWRSGFTPVSWLGRPTDPYSLQNSANIIVQNRLTGQLEEEKMQVYVRLGIRLLYKGWKSRMEGARGRLGRFPSARGN